MDRKDPILNTRIKETTPLVPPADLRATVPLSRAHRCLVAESRAEVANIVSGRDDRLLVVVGPCSVHDPCAALEYAHRLQGPARELRDRLLVVMRVFFEKPRTTIGWKGLLNDPLLDGSCRVDEGLLVARRLLAAVLSLGLPVGCEFLDTMTPHYIADTVSWGAIGARTSQSQIHRQLASGLSMPIGFKNSTEGGVQGAIDGVAAASHPQTFTGIDDAGAASVITTAGNPDCHVVLRGGDAGPNYGTGQVAEVVERLTRAGLASGLVIDASHGNSDKDHHRQQAVAQELAARIATAEPGIAGVMLESFLVGGRQDLRPGWGRQLRYGQSITDACMGWDETSEVLRELAGAACRRRAVPTPTTTPTTPTAADARMPRCGQAW